MAKKKQYFYLNNYTKIYFWKHHYHFTKFFSAQAQSYNPDLSKYKLL